MMKESAFQALEMSIERIAFLFTNSENIPSHVLTELEQLRRDNGFYLITR